MALVIQIICFTSAITLKPPLLLRLSAPRIECGFWQHIDCQERWGLYFERIGGRDLCCYCHNNWPEKDDGTGYYKIASEQSI